MFSPSVLAASAVALLMASNAAASCSNWSTRYQTTLTGVCVCNATQCDSVSNNYTSLTTGQVGVYSSTKAGDRFAYTVSKVDSTAVSSPTYSIDISTQYQTMIGFGGAFTDAATINFNLLTSALQELVLKQYFSETGLQYNLGRVPIASTDFSTSIYSYNDHSGDLAMDKFSIAVDKTSGKISLIQRALAMSSRDVKLFASSWAPPAWMTTENTTINCALIGDPGTAYWEALALYYSKFFTAYAAESIDFWAMTVQNEPSSSILQTSEWQSLRLTTDEERDFVKLDLGPMMAKNHPDLKIIAGDDQKSGILDRLAPFEDADSLKYISGLGVHWYRDLDFALLDLGGDFDKLESFYAKYPDIFILATEACEGYLPSWLGTGVGVSLTDADKSWYRAENYARDMIEDINAYASGWTDWNLFLDTTGGPNWAENYVYAPILVDEVSGTEFYKQPMFYAMGHLSKFVPAGSRRVEFPKTKTLSKFHRTAFVTPDKQVVMLFLNRDSSSVSVSVKQTDSKTFTLTLAARSINTVILPASSATTVLSS